MSMFIVEMFFRNDHIQIDSCLHSYHELGQDKIRMHIYRQLFFPGTSTWISCNFTHPPPKKKKTTHSSSHVMALFCRDPFSPSENGIWNSDWDPPHAHPLQ